MRYCFLSLILASILVVSPLSALIINRPLVPSRQQLECIYFSGAGIYFWWQAGCAKYIRQYCDIEEVPIIGASAGSLTSSLLLSGVDFDYAADTAIELANQFGVYNDKKSFVFWGPILRNWLEKILPNDISASQLNQLQVAITPASPFVSPKLVSGFVDKEDLIECLLASCHVPLLLDGKPFTEYRGEKYLDGSFWYFVTKDRFTGLPLPVKTDPKNVFWVDYCDDEAFMASISGFILETISPTSMLDMMASGYKYMETEHYEGRLPMARYPRNPSVQKLVFARTLTTPVTPTPVTFLKPPTTTSDQRDRGSDMTGTGFSPLQGLLSNNYARSSLSAISALSLTALSLQQTEAILSPFGIEF
jgi:hypothetical protein